LGLSERPNDASEFPGGPAKEENVICATATIVPPRHFLLLPYSLAFLSARFESFVQHRGQGTFLVAWYGGGALSDSSGCGF
jgi:hypothetical protein